MIEGVHLGHCGTLSKDEAEHAIGKNIVGIVNSEFYVEIWFDDGSCLRATGNSHGGALDVEVSKT